MREQMTQAKLLETLRADRSQWEALLAQIGEAHMTEPGVAGEWSVKDIIAHVTWGEREMVGLLQARALVGSDLWELPQDKRNAVVFEQNRNRPLRDVLAEASSVYQQLLSLLRALGDEDLTDPRRFAGMPSEWLPWDVIAGNTYEHYRAHMPSIRAWLGRAMANGGG